MSLLKEFSKSLDWFRALVEWNDCMRVRKKNLTERMTGRRWREMDLLLTKLCLVNVGDIEEI